MALLALGDLYYGIVDQVFEFLIFGRVTREYVPILRGAHALPICCVPRSIWGRGNQAEGSSGGILRFRLVVHAAEGLYKVFTAQFF